jgi:hypothetical protein
MGYHDYEGVALRDDEKPRLVDDLVERNFLMLRNHGLLTVGATVADAFLSMYLFETVCTIQVRAQAGGGALIPVDPRIIATAGQQAAVATRGLGVSLVWPGLLRRLHDIDDALMRGLGVGVDDDYRLLAGVRQALHCGGDRFDVATACRGLVDRDLSGCGNSHIDFVRLLLVLRRIGGGQVDFQP